MAHQRRLFPAWTQAEPDRIAAVNRHLPLAMHALESMVGAAIVAERFDASFIARVLITPKKFWQRKVRRSRSGKKKYCWSPSEDLRELQKHLANALFPAFTTETFFPAMAYGKGCSIIENAKFHRRSYSSIQLDLHDAFAAIRMNDISAYIVNANNIVASHDEHLAWIASRVFTRNGRLEQGSPIAPHLFNRMMERFDRDVCKATGAPIMPTTASYSDFVYTRYADDIVVSCIDDELPSDIEPALRAVIAKHGFHVNEAKTKVSTNGYVTVPGAVIRRGRIRPNVAYITRLILVWPQLNSAQRDGHRRYIASFGKGGKLKVLHDPNVFTSPHRAWDKGPPIPRRKNYPRRLA